MLGQELDRGTGLAAANALRTGNMIVDMLICMFIPLLIRLLMQQSFSGKISDWLDRLLAHSPWGTCIRSITYERNTGGRYSLLSRGDDLENTDRNNILQKAIRLYLNQELQIQTDKMESNLIPCKRVKDEKEDLMGCKRTVFSGSYQQLRSFIVGKLPQKSVWALVDATDSIYFRHFEHVDQSPSAKEENSRHLLVFQLKASGKQSGKRIDDFIDKAFAWYSTHKRLEQEADSSRYFFLATTPDEVTKDDGKKGITQFKQYVLSDHKKFSNLFFPGKRELLNLVDDFMHQKGKFAVDGFPQKLGLLLSGPPGTGKTSLIKALAHYTNRHIVSVNLARIKTNQELMDLMFDLQFPVHGNDMPLKMKFSELIFVMEDVDASSKVVYARQTKSSASPSSDVNAPDPQPLLRASTGEASDLPEEQPQQGDSATAALRVVDALADVMLAAKGDGEGSDAKIRGYAPPGVTRISFRPDDELNLAGLLNVIDGVVDAPGRILVMTTNHPEKLDAALIRPGRINRKMHLGYMDGESLCQMASHYLRSSGHQSCPLSLTDRSALEEVAGARCLTPAHVEQLCAEVDTVCELLKVLRTAI